MTEPNVPTSLAIPEWGLHESNEALRALQSSARILWGARTIYERPRDPFRKPPKGMRGAKRQAFLRNVELPTLDLLYDRQATTQRADVTSADLQQFKEWLQSQWVTLREAAQRSHYDTRPPHQNIERGDDQKDHARGILVCYSGGYAYVTAWELAKVEEG